MNSLQHCLERSVINTILEIFQLDTGMDGTMLLENSILVHDDDNRAMLRYSIRSHGSNLDGGKLVVVDTSDVDGSISHGNDADIIPCETTIGASIYQSTT